MSVLPGLWASFLQLPEGVHNLELKKSSNYRQGAVDVEKEHFSSPPNASYIRATLRACLI